MRLAARASHPLSGPGRGGPASAPQLYQHPPQGTEHEEKGGSQGLRPGKRHHSQGWPHKKPSDAKNVAWILAGTRAAPLGTEIGSRQTWVTIPAVTCTPAEEPRGCARHFFRPTMSPARRQVPQPGPATPETPGPESAFSEVPSVEPRPVLPTAPQGQGMPRSPPLLPAPPCSPQERTPGACQALARLFAGTGSRLAASPRPGPQLGWGWKLGPRQQLATSSLNLQQLAGT